MGRVRSSRQVLHRLPQLIPWSGSYPLGAPQYGEVSAPEKILPKMLGTRRGLAGRFPSTLMKILLLSCLALLGSLVTMAQANDKSSYGQ